MEVINDLLDSPVIHNSDLSFIEANTLPMTIEEIRDRHIIPVFAKDNETALSHVEFITATQQATIKHFQGVKILQPQIRVSHPIKGRIPEARNKAAKDLQDFEKTLYYERMAFVLEIPEIRRVIDGNSLSLIVGGVKAYNEDNLYNKKGSSEHFKIFIGFQNKVCLNLCIWTDGLKADVVTSDLDSLIRAICELLRDYDAERHLQAMEMLATIVISEHQFAKLIGRCKMYQYLGIDEKKPLPLLLFGDNHLSSVVKEYYTSDHFKRSADGSINLWKLFNLFTGANKNSYIDKYLERGLNASYFISAIGDATISGSLNWFLD